MAMFKSITVINPQQNEMEIDINVDNIVFVSEVDLPSNITGMDGQPKTNKGSSIALANGMMLNSPLTRDELLEVLNE